MGGIVYVLRSYFGDGAGKAVSEAMKRDGFPELVLGRAPDAAPDPLGRKGRPFSGEPGGISGFGPGEQRTVYVQEQFEPGHQLEGQFGLVAMARFCALVYQLAGGAARV